MGDHLLTMEDKIWFGIFLPSMGSRCLACAPLPANTPEIIALSYLLTSLYHVVSYAWLGQEVNGFGGIVL